MAGVQEEVGVAIDDGGGDLEGQGSCGGEPGRAEVAAGLVVEAAPGGGEEFLVERLDQLVENGGFGDEEVIGRLVGLEVDEELESGEGAGSGGVDDRDAEVVPAAGGIESASAGEGGGAEAAGEEPPDVHYRRLAVDAVGDALEDLFDGADAEVGIEEVEGAAAGEGAVGVVHPAGGLLAGAKDFPGESNNAGHAEGAVGLLVGKARVCGKAAAEGARGNGEALGDLGAMERKGAGQQVDGRGGQA